MKRDRIAEARRQTDASREERGPRLRFLLVLLGRPFECSFLFFEGNQMEEESSLERTQARGKE